MWHLPPPWQLRILDFRFPFGFNDKLPEGREQAIKAESLECCDSHGSNVCSFRYRHWSRLQTLAQVISMSKHKVCARCIYSRRKRTFWTVTRHKWSGSWWLNQKWSLVQAPTAVVKLHNQITEKQHERSSGLDTKTRTPGESRASSSFSFSSSAFCFGENFTSFETSKATSSASLVYLYTIFYRIFSGWFQCMAVWKPLKPMVAIAYYQGHHKKLHTLLPHLQLDLPLILQWLINAQANECLIICGMLHTTLPW